MMYRVSLRNIFYTLLIFFNQYKMQIGFNLLESNVNLLHEKKIEIVLFYSFTQI